jgi:hypothetical protein
VSWAIFLGKNHDRPGHVFIHRRQIFERVAARAVGIDQDYIGLQAFDFSRQIFGTGQNGGHLITGERQPGADFAGTGARFVNNENTKHAAYSASYRPAASRPAVAIA